MPTECIPNPLGLAPVDGRAVVADFDGGAITSDAGALLLGATDRAIGLVERFAACFSDGRAAERVEHSVETLVGQRVFGLALGYEDLIDHDDLRHDPVLGWCWSARGAARALRAAGRQEHAQPARADARGSRPLQQDRPRPRGDRGALRDLFLEAHPRRRRRSCSTSTPPTIRSTATSWGASSTATTATTAICRCTSSVAITCCWPAASCEHRRRAGTVKQLQRIVARSVAALAARCEIMIRADSGFCRETIMAWCEANHVDYVLGLAQNNRLVAADRTTSRPRPGAVRGDRAAGRRLHGVRYRDPQELEPRAAGGRQGGASARRGQPAVRGHVAEASRPGGAARRCTRRTTAPAARWRTASRSSSCICSPTAPATHDASQPATAVVLLDGLRVAERVASAGPAGDGTGQARARRSG